ncbi:MAG TPA: FkbM family methyltransferase [Candidatus Acidoferrales bacterium]|nr:FkbM family methyltransferase [Candidatus Acidoferrales bacterium]
MSAGIDDGRLTVYEIGARNGASHFAQSYCRIPDSFKADVSTIFFEPDETAVGQIEQRNDAAFTRVLPICLGEYDGSGTFYVNYDPYTSSLLKPAHDFEFTIADTTDYLFREVFSPVRELQMNVCTIDRLVREGLPSPTVLFLDTQGTELEIIRGGKSAVDEHTVAILTEAEFVQFYEGQSLFGDLCRELATMGFVFVEFIGPLGSLDPFRVPFGFRNKTFAGYCDALFLRIPKTLSRNSSLLARLAFVAHCFGQTAFAFECMSILERIDPNLSAVPRERVFGRFLCDLAAASKSMVHFFPPTFVDLYPTPEASAARFVVGEEAYVASIEERSRDHMRQQVRERLDDVRRLLDLSPSPIEDVLLQYGFTERSKELCERRISETMRMLASLGIRVNRV